MVDDVKSNGEMVFRELELLESRLKFRGPGTGDSGGGGRGEKLKDVVRRGSIVSISCERDEFCPRGGFRIAFWR